jgi:D-beta-D-heptose 7-phosphate kinase/D-beta-D-heptose 1-phosphate adenosyltransferase
MAGVNLLTHNFGERVLLAGLSATRREHSDANVIAADHYERHCPTHSVMTRGERDMLLRISHGTSRHFPSIVHQVADVSAANNTVIATLAAAMAAGIVPEDGLLSPMPPPELKSVNSAPLPDPQLTDADLAQTSSG